MLRKAGIFRTRPLDGYAVLACLKGAKVTGVRIFERLDGGQTPGVASMQSAGICHADFFHGSSNPTYFRAVTL